MDSLTTLALLEHAYVFAVKMKCNKNAICHMTDMTPLFVVVLSAVSTTTFSCVLATVAIYITRRQNTGHNGRCFPFECVRSFTELWGRWPEVIRRCTVGRRRWGRLIWYWPVCFFPHTTTVVVVRIFHMWVGTLWKWVDRTVDHTACVVLFVWVLKILRPCSQTCIDLSNQTGIKEQGGRAEGMTALKCVCAYLHACVRRFMAESGCLCACLLILWTSEVLPVLSSLARWIPPALLSFVGPYSLYYACSTLYAKKAVLRALASSGPLQINLSVEGVRARRRLSEKTEVCNPL